MILKDLIAFLEARDPAQVVPVGFANPHSYRGHYDCLAFEPVEQVTVGSMLACAREALGTTYEGYKGGDYEMSEYTDVYLSDYGTTGESIGLVLLGYMVGDFSAWKARHD